MVLQSMRDDLERVLFHEDEIEQRLDELAATITSDFAGKPLTVLAILHGSLIFMADLLRRIPLPLKISCVQAASYGHATESSGEVRLGNLERELLDARHVLLLDDILDSGLTQATVHAEVSRVAEPIEIKSCVLLNKRRTRVREFTPDYFAFEIENEFVVGYGLDFAGHYRNLPCIGILKGEVLASLQSPANY